MGVKDKGLWERFLYRYIFKGSVEREGKLYKKYEKIPRFKNPKKVLSAVFILLLLVVISSFVIYLMQIAN
jgi:hypothetical protein